MHHPERRFYEWEISQTEENTRNRIPPIRRKLSFVDQYLTASDISCFIPWINVDQVRKEKRKDEKKIDQE